MVECPDLGFVSQAAHLVLIISYPYICFLQKYMKTKENMILTVTGSEIMVRAHLLFYISLSSGLSNIAQIPDEQKQRSSCSVINYR